MTYRYETLEYPREKQRIRLNVDATYVIHVGPDEWGEAEKKRGLAVMQLSETVRFLHVPVMSTGCYMSVFRDSLDRKYDRILVLADAGFYRQTLPAEEISEMNAFLNDRSNEPYVYALGCLPIFMMPARQHAYRALGLGVCAAIYNKSFREAALQEAGEKERGNWDLFLLRHNALYTHSKPLFYCLQCKPILQAIGLWYDCAKLMIYVVVLFALGLFWTLFHYNQVYTFLRTYVRKISVYGYTLNPVIEKLKPIISLLRPSSLHNPS